MAAETKPKSVRIPATIDIKNLQKASHLSKDSKVTFFLTFVLFMEVHTVFPYICALQVSVCAVCSMNCTVCSVQGAVCSVECAVCSMQSAVRSD